MGQTIQFSIGIVSISKTVLFQVIPFGKSTQFSSIWLIDRILSGATTPGQSGSGSDGNKEVLCIPQSSSITEASSSDCLVSYTGHSLGKSYPSAEMQSVYSAAPTNRATYFWPFIKMSQLLKMTTILNSTMLTTMLPYKCILLAISCSVMVNKLGKLTIASKFDSH